MEWPCCRELRVDQELRVGQVVRVIQSQHRDRLKYLREAEIMHKYPHLNHLNNQTGI